MTLITAGIRCFQAVIFVCCLVGTQQNLFPEDTLSDLDIVELITVLVVYVVCTHKNLHSEDTFLDFFFFFCCIVSKDTFSQDKYYTKR